MIGEELVSTLMLRTIYAEPLLEAFKTINKARILKGLVSGRSYTNPKGERIKLPSIGTFIAVRQSEQRELKKEIYRTEGIQEAIDLCDKNGIPRENMQLHTLTVEVDGESEPMFFKKKSLSKGMAAVYIKQKANEQDDVRISCYCLDHGQILDLPELVKLRDVLNSGDDPELAVIRMCEEGSTTIRRCKVILPPGQQVVA